MWIFECEIYFFFSNISHKYIYYPIHYLMFFYLGVNFTTGARILNVDRRENDAALWNAESVFISMDLTNTSYPNLEMEIMYTIVTSNFGSVPANCSIDGLSVNCTLGSIPISYNALLFVIFIKALLLLVLSISINIHKYFYFYIKFRFNSSKQFNRWAECKLYPREYTYILYCFAFFSVNIGVVLLFLYLVKMTIHDL